MSVAPITAFNIFICSFLIAQFSTYFKIAGQEPPSDAVNVACLLRARNTRELNEFIVRLNCHINQKSPHLPGQYPMNVIEIF